MDDMLNFQLGNIKSNMPWIEADLLKELIQYKDRDILGYASGLISDAMKNKISGEIYIPREAVYPFYKLFISGLTDTLAYALYNCINANKDYFYRYYLLDEDDSVKRRLQEDISIFKTTCMLPDDIILCLFKLNGIMHNVVRGEYSISSYIPELKSQDMVDVKFTSSGYDQLINNIIYMNVNAAQIVSITIEKIMKIILQQNKVNIEMSSLYAYFYKHATEN